MADVWPLVHAERHALIADLEGLTDQQWGTPSLCAGWTVHDVAAHLVGNAGAVSIPGLAVAIVRARFDFDRLNAQALEHDRGDTPAETLQRLREVADLTEAPPLVPLDVRLVEEVVHGEDVRRPLGLTRDYPVEAVVPALEHQVRTKVSIGGGRERAAGVRLRATDADVVIGDGPEVTGPLRSLLLAVSGRSAARADLSGPGLPLLG
jgi:uncharacterized protein (TIGR03083 family)